MRSACGFLVLVLSASVAAAPIGKARVSMDRERAKDLYEGAQQKFVDSFDAASLKPTLKGLTQPGGARALSAAGLLQLKAARKSGAIMRSLFVSLDRRHEPPSRLHEYVRTFGRLNDAIEANVPDETVKQARALLSLVKHAGGDKIIASTADFRATSGRSFDEYMGAALHEVEARLAKPTLPVNEFHEMRKDLKRLMNVFELLDTPLNRSAGRASRFLSTLNDQLGSLHDRVVQRSLRGEIKYDDAVVSVPKRLRERARAFLATVSLD